MIKVVNGFVCSSSCDVALAKKGIDPKNPHNDPVKAAQLKAQKALASGKAPDDGAAPAAVQDGTGSVSPVSFGGALAGLNARRPADSGPAPASSAALDLLA